MTKKKDKRYSREAQLDRDVGQLTDVVDWGLDIAAKLARDDDDDREAIESVRAFVHGWIKGRRAEVPLTDLLTTIAIVFAAIEIDFDLESVSLLAPLRTMRETPSTLPAILRCPGQERGQTFVIRRSSGRRNASAAFTQLDAA